MIFISLINNIALLVAISILYSFILRKWYYETKTHQIISGFLFGCVTIVCMLNPFVWIEVVIFDGRSIIISVAGFFGGPLTAAITAIIAAGFRIYLGGSGVYMGITVITGSAVIGVIFHKLRIRNEKFNKPLQMYLFALLVHVFMLAATIALPSKLKAEALYIISIPVLLLYPIGSLLVCILFQDLLSKIRIELALKKSESNYRELVEDVDSLILRLDSHFNITFLNNYAKKILFSGRKDIAGENFISRLLSMSRFEKNSDLSEMLTKRSDSNQYFETEIEDNIGTVYWISWILNPVYNESGEIQEVMCVGADMTERKKSEIALDTTKKYLEFALDNTNSSVFENNYETGEIVTSYGLYQYLGYAIEEIPKKINDLPNFIHTDDINLLTNMINKQQESEPYYYIEFRMKSKTGEWIWCSGYGKVIDFSNKGKIKKVIGIATQINERKRAEEERRRLQHLESLGILAGGVAHDFNNILTVIMGKASLAHLLVKEEKIKNMLESITDATVRAKGLTQQLLTFAKGGAPEKKIVDLEKVITEITKFSVSGSNIEVNFDFKHKFSLEADPAQVSQVIQNIVINAAQAMKDGGNIDIFTADTTIDSNDFVKIIISDTGPGISEENLAKIFDPYFTTKSTGSGLGLSVCHSIIKRHEGRLTVSSKPGEGTRFDILLPATIHQKQDVVEKKSTVVGKLSVLIMDDDNDILELLSGMLSYLGHQVEVCSNGYEAVQKVKEYLDEQKQFDLAILDFTIKGSMGGLETAIELQKIAPAIKKMISSGYLDSSIREKVKDESIEIFDKPYTIQKLHDKLASIFGNI
jgi:PAS domain S-box-containing protein